MKRLSLYALLLVLAATIQAQGLKDFLPEGKYIGTAISSSYLSGGSNIDGYNETFIRDFNCVVAENAYKMAYIIPDRPADPFNLTLDDLSATQLQQVDAMIDTAAKYNMRTRGHAFIWHSQAPSWLTTDAQSWTSQQIYDFVESYITVFGTYCKGRINEWDVVNEALNDNGNGFRQGTWYDNVADKQDFIEHCFEVAHAVDPDAELFYNDYSIELYKFTPHAIGNVKNGPMLQMVNAMIDHGAPIHGVGLQSHYVSGSGMTDSTYIALNKTVDSLNVLGLFCSMTELDIRICGGTSEDDLLKQYDEYNQITDIFLANDNCKSMLVWGITDASSWIPGVFSGCDDPLLYDKDMQIKLAYIGVKQAIMQASGIYEGPFSFIPPALPGIIEAENYDYDAYYDTDAGNTGGVYRTDSVDIVEGNTGYVVGWMEAGEYLTYTVDVTIADTFNLDFVYSSDLAEGIFSELELMIDSVALADRIMLPTTGSLDTYDTLIIDSVLMEPGLHTIQLNVISGGANIDYIDFSTIDCNGDRNGTAFIDKCETCVGGNTGLEACIIRNPYTAMSIPGTVQAENYDEGDNGVTYFDNTEGNEGGAYRTDDVDIAAGSGDEYWIGWVEAGEWLEYTLTIDETADYDITFRIASNLTTGRLNLLVNGETVISSMTIPNTGGWTTFQNKTVQNVSLVAGEAVLRIDMTGSYFNIDYLQFEKSAIENAVPSIDLSKLNVRPNPFVDELWIEGLQAHQKWQLYTIDGIMLREGTETQISTSELTPGLYILRTDNQNIRLVKM